MKLTLEFPSYGKKIIIETEGDDQTMEDLFQTYEDLTLAAGYHPETVKAWFNPDDCDDDEEDEEGAS